MVRLGNLRTLLPRVKTLSYKMSVGVHLISFFFKQQNDQFSKFLLFYQLELSSHGT